MGILQVIPPALLKTKLFEGLEQGEMRALVNKGDLRTYETDAVVIKEGETGDEFFNVVSGLVEIQLAAAGKEPVGIKTLKEGDILGEMILLKKNTRTASAVVKAKADLIVWNYKDCLDLFATNPVLGYKIMRNLATLISNKLTDMNALYRDK